MGVFKEIEKADGSGVTTFYRLSDVHDTVETDDSEGTATVIDYNAAQNKPSVNGVTLVGNKTSEDLGLQPAGDYITNDEADAKFIDEDELEAKNYVNETRLQEAIANIDHFHREIVNALPVTGQDNVLYMVRKQGSGEDIFNEYIWVGKTVSETGYEFIGTTATDLTDYYQKDEVDDLLDGKVDKVSGRGLSEQNYTLSEKTKLAGLHNYDDTELQVKVANLHNYDDTDLQLRVGDLEVREEADSNAISTIQDALNKKMICIRLVEQGDGWTWMDINGSRLTFDRAQAYLGQENCMLFVEQLENDGKVIPAEYKSETTRIRVLFKDLDSLVHIMTLGEEDLLVEDVITTEDGACDFEVENEAVDFGARLDEFYGNTSQEVIAAEAGTEVIDKSVSINDVDTSKENYITLKGNTSQDTVPDGYTTVEYVESSGDNQYIDTGYKYEKNDNIKLTFMPLQANVDKAVFGQYETGKTCELGFLNNNLRGNVGADGPAYSIDTIYSVEEKGGKWYYNGTSFGVANNENASQNCYLFCRRFNGNPDKFSKVRVYSLTVIRDGKTILNFVPCFRNNDNAIGFYDLASKTFFTNSGTGTFVKGGNSVFPNVNCPQEVYTVSEDNEIAICGKNFAYLKDGTYTKGDDSAIISNNLITFNTSGSTGTNSYFSFGNGYTQTWAPAGDGIKNVNDLKLTGDGGNYIATIYTNKTISGSISFRIYTSNNRELIINIGGYTTTTINISLEDGEHIKDYGLWSGTATIFNDYQIRIQLEKGSTSTSYEPYQNQTYDADLGDIELCKIGNYQDYLYKKGNNWYKKEFIGKYILDGTDNTFIENSATKGLFQVTLTNTLNDWDVMGAVSTHLKGVLPRESAEGSAPSSLVATYAGNRIFFRINEYKNNIAGLKLWLSNHNIIVYYVHQTPEDKQVTDSTLVSQLNTLYNGAPLSHQQANIFTKSNKLSPYIDLKYNVVTPAPSPDRPSEVKVVKGNNTMYSEGSHNLLLLDNRAYTTSQVSGVNITYTNNLDQTVTLSGTLTGNKNLMLLGKMNNGGTILTLKPNTTYTAKIEKLSGSINCGCNFILGASNSQNYQYVALTGSSATMTFTTGNSSRNIVNLRLYTLASGTINLNDLTVRVQIQEGNTDTPYEPFVGNRSYPLSLGQIELCKLSTHQDKIYKQNDTWYLHKETNKMVLNGSENWSKYGTGTATWFYYVGVASGVLPNSIYYSNLYPQADVSTTTDDGFTFNSTGGVLRVRYGAEDTVENYKNFLVSHNLVVYYPLATPIDTEITDPTLLTQLDNLQQITQYKHTYINLIPTADNEMPDAKFTYISNAVINASDRVLGKDTYWNNEVATQADLPSDAEEGEIRIVQDTQNVYIYDGYQWVPFDKGGEVDLSNYLAKDNTTAWVPTGAFNPATKKYVDDSVGGVFVPTKTSQLTNDSNFIGKNSNDLTYYYTKTQTYTKSEVDALIGGGGGGGNISITVSGDTLVITTE